MKNRTHIISSKRYQVVLYNLDAIKGIHPVSDKVLFETTLNYEERKQLLESAKSATFEIKNVCIAARQGYICDDKIHVHYQILNSVSGFLVYYYSFQAMSSYRCPSKVKEKGISSDIEEESIPSTSAAVAPVGRAKGGAKSSQPSKISKTSKPTKSTTTTKTKNTK